MPVPQFPYYSSVSSPTSPARAVLDGHAVTGSRSVIGTRGVFTQRGWADTWAIKFNGVNSYATRSIVGFPSAAASLSAWVRVDTAFTAGLRYALVVPSAGPTNYMGFWKIEGTNDFSIRGSTTVGGAFVITRTSPAGHNLGQWYHFLCTYDGTDIKAYVDGALVGTVNRPGTTLMVPGSNLFAGRGGSVYSPISVRQVSVWNRAVSVAEVATDNLPIDLAPANSAGTLVPASGLLYWWQFGNGYVWDTYSLANTVASSPMSWVNGTQTTQVVLK